MKAKSIYIYSNGTFSCRDENGEQMQSTTWMELLLQHLEDSGIDPRDVETIETIVNGQTRFLKAIKTEEGKWNWSFHEF